MCGIAGYLFLSDHLSSTTALSCAMDSLAHRGPDDAGLSEELTHRFGLAHTRLSILDLSPLGHQPMASDDEQVVLVFNGEIYNFHEIRAELVEEGYSFRGHSDTEVLLKLYLAQRQSTDSVAAMLQRLNGIFAFALWDVDREALLLARDALGVKPLYYSTTEQGLAFASEIKALLPLMPAFQNGSGNHPLSHLDAAAIDRYLSFLWCPGAGTPIRNVHMLGPGEAVWVQAGKIAERLSWYQLPAFRPNHPAKGGGRQLADLMTADTAIKEAERHLRQAVHRQMVADVPVGAFLSGGLDSSSIVAFAREQQPDLECFTIEVTGTEQDGFTDDLPYARRVAEHLKVPLKVVQIDSARMAQDLPMMIAQLDEPLADPAPLNVLYISRLAREQGIKVLLSGAGGDDLLTGYRRHRALMAERYWNWLPLAAKRRLEEWSQGLDQRRSLGRRLRKLFNGAALKGDAKLIHYFRWIDRADLNRLYSREFRVALHDDTDAEAPMRAFLAELPSDTHPLERLLALEQRFFLTDHNLTYTDKMSMAVGVEVRVPFLDLDLVEFAAQIPPQYKQRGSEGKWVLKKAMEPYLPKDVIYRPKSGFGAPLRHWMRSELRELLADVLSEQSLNSRGLFDPAAVNHLIQANDRGEIDASYTLLSLTCIELWCRHFMDQTGMSVKAPSSLSF